MTRAVNTGSSGAVGHKAAWRIGMALIVCPNCRALVSEQAPCCPSCGRGMTHAAMPVAAADVARESEVPSTASPPRKRPLLRVHPHSVSTLAVLIVVAAAVVLRGRIEQMLNLPPAR